MSRIGSRDRVLSVNEPIPWTVPRVGFYTCGQATSRTKHEARGVRSGAMPSAAVGRVIDSSSSSPKVEVLSSSWGGMSPMDAKAFKALGVMRLCHDCDWVVIDELLVKVQKHYSILNEGQGSYYLNTRSGSWVGEAPCNNKGWKTRHLFISDNWAWGLRLEWLAHTMGNVPPYLFDEESEQFGQLKGILSSSRAIREVTEGSLVEAGLSSAPRDMSNAF
ncbi:hypothetical protein B296_00037637 [Ensete ventricosum]|uniref:Uncharacterized protein n=1 Tax=Ensete ventricosum TaxID=4639 RepID=A0A426YZX8_ENSVE|nr:hypothetical protein B296_00037637 [Ensete ventricosum]